MQKRCVDMATLPWPVLLRGAPPKKKGPLEDERPKSREETPKVGYDTFGRMPNHAAVAHMGLFGGQFNRNMAAPRCWPHERCDAATMLLYPPHDPG